MTDSEFGMEPEMTENQDRCKKRLEGFLMKTEIAPLCRRVDSSYSGGLKNLRAYPWSSSWLRKGSP